MSPADSAPLPRPLSVPVGSPPANDGGALLAGRYRLETLLGAGGMGEVWAAHDIKLKREVAIKRTHFRLKDHPEFAPRFIRETELAARLSHPNIPRIYTTEIAPDGRLFMVMERVQGITLRRLVQMMGKVPAVQVICYAMYAAEALGYAHDAGICHRDIKPENLMVSANRDEPGAWLLDFGIAKLLVLDEVDAAARESAESAPRAGKRRSTVLGTLGYVPPEVALGGVADHRGDFFQLGVTLYEALSGEKPFPVREDDATGMLTALVYEEPPGLPVDECPAGLWALLMRLMAKAPEDRYDSAEELHAALMALFRESVPPEHPMAQVLRRDRQDQVVRKAFASVAPPKEEMTASTAPEIAQGGTEPIGGRPTLPMGAAFVKKGPGYAEAVGDAAGAEGARMTMPMTPGAAASPAHPAARAQAEQKKAAAPVTAPLGGGVAAVVMPAWVAPVGVQPVPPAPVQPASVPPVQVLSRPPMRRGLPAVLAVTVLVLGAVALAIGVGMILGVRYARPKDEGSTATTAPTTTAAAEPTPTAEPTAAAIVTAAPTASVTAAPTARARLSTAKPAEKQRQKAPEILEPVFGSLPAEQKPAEKPPPRAAGRMFD